MQAYIKTKYPDDEVDDDAAAADDDNDAAAADDVDDSAEDADGAEVDIGDNPPVLT